MSLHKRVAMKFRHGQFRLVDRGSWYDIVGTGDYEVAPPHQKDVLEKAKKDKGG